LPPLRERIGDILPLALELLNKHKASTGRNASSFDTEAVRKLQSYSWPGNVRELENVIQRALILQTASCIMAEDLIFEDEILQMPTIQEQLPFLAEQLDVEKTFDFLDKPSTAPSLEDGVRSAEEKIILQMLTEASGSRKTTAEKLGISPRTLRYKIARMKESGIMVPC
jgi:two-component system response regulator FlrC